METEEQAEEGAGTETEAGDVRSQAGRTLSPGLLPHLAQAIEAGLDNINGQAIRVTTADLIPYELFFTLMPYFVKAAGRHTCVCWKCHGMTLLLVAMVKQESVWKAVCPPVAALIARLRKRADGLSPSTSTLMNELLCDRDEKTSFFRRNCCRSGKGWSLCTQSTHMQIYTSVGRTARSCWFMCVSFSLRHYKTCFALRVQIAARRAKAHKFSGIWQRR